MTRRESVPYQLFMLALSVAALAALTYEGAVRPTGEVRQVLAYIDLVLCGLFLIDFALNLWRAERRLQYLRTWGWLDLLSSIPTLDAARWGRVARITRVLRVLRAVRATSLIGRALLERRTESAWLAATFVSLLVMTVASISILNVETAPDSNIKGAEDAVWWALTTMTTVGYGDRFPVTTEGRLVAGMLMCAGVGLFGTLSGLLAAWFVAPGERQESAELAAVRAELAALRASLGSSALVSPEGTATEQQR